MTEAN